MLTFPSLQQGLHWLPKQKVFDPNRRIIHSQLTGEERLIYVRKAVNFFFLAGIGFSINLWISDRSFPLLPVLPFLPASAHSINYALLLLLVILLISSLFFSKKTIDILIILLVLILLLQDQNRWQPWVYIYFLFLLPFGLWWKGRGTGPPMISYFQIILIGIYAWSGVHKLNPNFINTTFHEIITQFFWFKDVHWISTLNLFGYAIPGIEIGIAMTLFLPTSFRNLAVYVAILTHIFILFFLSPLGIDSNSVVYPWNLAMITLVFLLFHNVSGPIALWGGGPFPILHAAGILLTWILPVLNFWGYWDNYLSFNLYSGKPHAFYIAVADNELSKIDRRLSESFLTIKGMRGGKIIDVNKWAMNELNVPFYPETRTLKKIAAPFCKLGIAEGQLYFLEFELPFREGKFLRFSCQDI